jgi:hypothetical protein
MLEEAYGKAAMKKMQVYEWQKRFRDDRASVSDDRLCGPGDAKDYPRRAYCEQWNVNRNQPLPQRSNEKDKLARHICFLLHDNAAAHRSFVVRNYLTKQNVSALEHPSHSLDLLPSDLFLCREDTDFGVEKKSLTEVSQNDIQECF